MRTISLAIALALTMRLSAQPIVYKDASSLITGVWAAAGTGGTATLAEVTTASAYEGSLHYKFDYTFFEYWAGVGLNMDNWGTSSARNFSGYNHLRIAYRGLSSNESLSIQLRNGNTYGNTVQVGSPTSAYTVVDIPFLSLTAGTNLNVNSVREIDLSIGNALTGTGTLYIDAIELVNISTGAGQATATTWARANAMGRGINTSNWLEAYWLIPFNSYPEINKYDRTNVSALKDAGFQTFRLPVTFEQISPTTPPYTINFDQISFRLVDSMILWANLFDFKLIIDNHHGYTLSNANYQTELPRLKAIWAQLATRYGALDPDRFFFEIYNEATSEISNQNFRTVATEVVAEIRANESVLHSLIVGASGWNSGPELVNFLPLADQNIIYTFHNYDPYLFTHQGMSWTSPAYYAPRTFPQSGEVAAINQVFSAVKTWSNTYQVPVFLGEYGAAVSADATSRCNWIQTLNSAITTQGFPHFYWDVLSPTDGFGFYANGIVSQANVTPCFAAAIGLYSPVLAIDLSEFSIQCNGNLPELRWTATSSGHVSDRFFIEVSNDGISWQNAKQVAVKSGVEHYVWRDITSSTYYRLRMVDQDGTTLYSAIEPSPCTKNRDAVTIYPNPAFDQITIKTSQELTQIAIYDLTGRIVSQIADLKQGPNSSVQIAINNLNPGIYLIHTFSSEGVESRHQLVVAR
jgi:endoglucanase